MRLARLCLVAGPLLAAVALALSSGPQAPEAEPPLVLARFAAPYPAAGHRIADVDGDGTQELILLGQAGEVRVWRHSDDAFLAGPIGSLTLPDARHTLVDLASLLEAGGLQLIAATPAGLVAHAFGTDGAPSTTPTRLARRARFVLRVPEPTLAGIVQDVNADGLPDVVLPRSEVCELWLNTGPRAGGEPDAAAWPSFRRAATISVAVSRWGNQEGENLSEVLESSFSIPSLNTRDVNGDERPDLLVFEGARRSFHLQEADGSFPAQPDVTCDLDIFRDTVEAARLQPGQTLAVGDDASYESTDLDADGIPDYVIAHRRKVWVFHGSREGPQFQTPAQILKSAEDVTALTLLDLDEDQLPDLLLVKVQVPTIAALVRGIFGQWDIDVSAAGFRNLGEGRFETTSSQRGGAVVRLPSILNILRKPEDLLERFEDAEKRFRQSVNGDYDGDGTTDVALISEDGTRFDVWLAAPGDSSFELEAHRIVRELLFNEDDRVWDIDRLVQGLGNLAERRVAGLTGGRPPDLALSLRPTAEAALVSAKAGDFDGDGRAELLMRYALGDGTEFEVLRIGE